MPEPTPDDVVGQIPAQVLAEASAAAQAVFDQAMHLMSPNRVFVDAAIAAAGAVFVNALDANIGRRAEVTAAALNIRDQRDALQTRVEASADRIHQLRAALRDVATAADLAYPTTEDALRAVRERAEAALRADGQRQQ